MTVQLDGRFGADTDSVDRAAHRVRATLGGCDVSTRDQRESVPCTLPFNQRADDDLDVMLVHCPLAEGDVVMPEDAIRNQLTDLDAERPYIVTHGALRSVYTQRRDAMDDTIDRMANL